MKRMTTIILAVVLALAVVLSGVASALTVPIPRQPAEANGASALLAPNAASLSEATIAAAATAAPSVVKIQTASGLGSGVIVDSRGYIVTNYHVLAGTNGRVGTGAQIDVALTNGKSYPATLVRGDAPDDMAVLRIAAPKLRAIRLADSAKVRAGEFVLALGNPLGYSQTVTFGIVSTPKRTVAENGPATFIPDMIQTSVPINPGNSGGALVNLQGELVGIPALAATDPRMGNAAQGIGFAIPSNRVDFIAKQVIAQGKILHSGRSYLGISSLQSVTLNSPRSTGSGLDRGVLIGGLAAQGPAARAGLRVDDVIVRLQGVPTTDELALGEALARLQPKQQVTITVMSEGAERTVKLTLGELPVEQ